MTRKCAAVIESLIMKMTFKIAHDLSVPKVSHFGLFLLCFGIFAVPVGAQSRAAGVNVRGKVLDPNRAVVTGASIRIQASNFQTTIVTDRNGEFALALAPDSYTMSFEAEGFGKLLRQITISSGKTEWLEIVLPVADSTATVTIVAADFMGYRAESLSSATKTLTNLRDIPQSITVVSKEQIRDQSMGSIADVVNYIPGITSHQGENNRDQIVIRGNSSSADFFLNGVRDDVQYYRDLYNVNSVEALKGPNAMVFGRGGGGGVINRVTKAAGFTPLREFVLQGGSFDNKRVTADFNQPFNKSVAVRVNGLYENSGSFRQFVSLQRYGINPSVTFAPTNRTTISLSYEHFYDGRTADRGLPSYLGKPADLPISTFFGDPTKSYARARVNLLSGVIEHQAGRLNIRSRTQFGDYDRAYQNFVPGAVNASKSLVNLTAYNNATGRRNLFNQTDFIYLLRSGRVRHTILSGLELGRQFTDNFRNTGFFNNTATTIQVSYDNPTIGTPITFRQSATDANNHLRTNLAATYVQDQIEFSQRVQLVAGVRFDYFDLHFHNNRNGDSLRRIDRLVSPRVGLVVKPVTALSVYANYSVAYLPSSGDQFSSLTVITQQVKPEKFTNYEIGAKWDLRNNLALTAALYRQNRTNTRSIDPNDPTRILQTGSQRTNGFELGINGNVTRKWQVVGGYAHQDAFISSATTAAPKGAQVAMVPHHTFSIWNNYQVIRKVGFGLGLIHRADMFAAIDNTVVLPAYIRADAAVFINFNENWRLQTNLTNLFNKKYYLNADGNNNISPGSPRGARVSLIARF